MSNQRKRIHRYKKRRRKIGNNQELGHCGLSGLLMSPRKLNWGQMEDEWLIKQREGYFSGWQEMILWVVESRLVTFSSPSDNDQSMWESGILLGVICRMIAIVIDLIHSLHVHLFTNIFNSSNMRHILIRRCGWLVGAFPVITPINRSHVHSAGIVNHRKCSYQSYSDARESLWGFPVFKGHTVTEEIIAGYCYFLMIEFQCVISSWKLYPPKHRHTPITLIISIIII